MTHMRLISGRRAACAAIVVWLGLLLAALSAPRAQQGVDFHLDLDTGGHRAFVKDLAFTPDGELLLSASDDKTIRVWDWQAGISIRTIRGQIGAGNEGKIFAIDVSPDGETVAAGGYFGPGLDEPPYGDVRLFDIGTGKLVATLEGLDYAVFDLAFSPDGTMIAAGGQDGFVQLWSRGADGAWSASGRLDAETWRIERVVFLAEGRRLAAATADNGLALFDVASGERVAMPEAADLADDPLSAMAGNATGSLFATGSFSGAVDVWNAESGVRVASLPAFDHQIGALAFTPDEKLVVSCGYPCPARNGSTVWDLDNTDAPATQGAPHDDIVTASAVRDADGLVATAGGERNEILVWKPVDAAIVATLVGSGEPVSAVGIADDGSAIAWGTINPCPREATCPELLGELRHRLLLPTMDRGFERPDTDVDPPAFRRATRSAEGWALDYAAGGDYGLPNAVLQVTHDGETLHEIVNDETNGFLHAAFTLLSDGRGVVTGGSEGTLIEYVRESGDFAGEFRGGHTGQVHAMAEAPRARLLLTGSADQTMRLWNLDTRELVVSLFFSGEEWIIWTPQGYFYSSPMGDDLVGWHVNQGAGSEARFVKARQLREHLNSPEIVRRAIITGNAAQAALELRGTDSQLSELLQRRPPEFSVRLAEDVPAPEGFVAVEIVGAVEAGADVSEFAVMSNDRRVEEVVPRSAGGAGERIVIEVPVIEGENDIMVSGVNEFGYVTERGVRAIAPKASDKPKGKLYVVAVGVNAYPFLPTDCGGRACDLRFPVADAAEFVRLVADRTAPLHAEMEALLLVNREALGDDPQRAADLVRIVGEDRIMEPEAGTIEDEIIDFLDLPGPDDTTIVFLAGHGINVDEDYYFIPTDGRKQDGDRWRRSSLVDWADIHEAVERADGRRFVLLDTCHAANAYNAKLEKEAADARIVVLAATAANNTAAELAQLGHGVFTHAVLDGMRGRANTGGDGVRILGLSDYIDREVRRLTNDRQAPFYHIPRTENFLVARP